MPKTPHVLEVQALPDRQEHARARRIAASAIRRLGLDLTGLTVYTEAATGPYAYSACLAALAGGQVIALARDSRWGAAEDIAAAQALLARHWDLANPPRVVFEKNPEDFALADIVTNSGQVRPLDAQCLGWMRPTAVIPLMWETYEWRPDELDLAACRRLGILVLGTDETRMGFLDFVPETIIKLLHSAGIAVHDGTFLYLASGPITECVVRHFGHLGAQVRVSAHTARPDDPAFLSPASPEFLPYLKRCDAVICDERFDRRPLIGDNGLISLALLQECCPGITIVNRHGILENAALQSAGIPCVPTASPVPWHMPAATTAILGLRPTLTLVAAGLKVGEAMARLRLQGRDVAWTAAAALGQTFAQDFPPPNNWVPSQQPSDTP